MNQFINSWIKIICIPKCHTKARLIQRSNVMSSTLHPFNLWTPCNDDWEEVWRHSIMIRQPTFLTERCQKLLHRYNHTPHPLTPLPLVPPTHARACTRMLGVSQRGEARFGWHQRLTISSSVGRMISCSSLQTFPARFPELVGHATSLAFNLR